MYESHVGPVIDYSVAVWVIQNLKKGAKFKLKQLNTTWEFIGMHQSGLFQ